MDTWARSSVKGAWERWRDVGLGLDAIAAFDHGICDVVVVGEESPDDNAVAAVVHLIRRVLAGPATVIAGTEHPSASWYESVRQAGADRALLVSRSGGIRWRDAPPLKDAHELSPAICPALHAQHSQGITLSVCGRHDDHMVLASHHLQRWCLAAKEQCPHWTGRGV